MADLVGGAALGAVFGELLRAVEDVALKAVNFNSILKRLSSMLNRISPAIEEIEKLNEKLGRTEDETKEFTNRLERGLKLVRKCAKIHRLNYFKKPFYAYKLLNLEESIAKFFQIDVQLQLAVDSKTMLVKFNGMDAALERITTMGKGKGFAGCCGAPDFRDFVLGLDEPLQELKMLLLHTGEQVVVLSALGGCGKTTLAKMFCHDDEVKEKFKENIFFVTASKAPNLMFIIEKLFQHEGYLVPELQTDEEAIYHLERMLKQIGPNPVLLVLDDVWSGLESLVEDLTVQISNIKILVTSRFVFPRFDATYKLKLLNNQDATDLFCRSAFPKGGRSTIPDNLVNEMVRGCGGFPLALKVVGRSLCGQPEEIWKRMLKQWSEGRSIIYSDNKLLDRLQSSLTTLEQTHMECYLDLSLFPEDQRIPATALIDIWIELYNLDEDGEDAIANLQELSMRGLVDLVITRKDASGSQGYYNEHYVMQHDLLRDLAIHQSGQKPVEQRKRLIMEVRGNDPPSWWINQVEQPIQAHVLSMSTDESFSSNWYDLKLPMVEVTVLNIQTKKYTLPQFMEKMDQLKVLIITHYGFCSAEISNIHLLGHLSSLKRIRFERISISSISNSVLQLRNLRKISLIMCEIADAFRSSTIQISDMLPNLAEIDIDYCNDLAEIPGWLCNVSCLKKLIITNCHELVVIPEELGKLENLELLRLHACTKLLKLPESIGRLQKLGFLDLSDCISISKLPEQIGELCGLRKLHMRDCHGLSELPLSVKNLKQLNNVICDEEIALLWEHYQMYLTNLEITVVKEDVNLHWLRDMQP